MLTTQLAVTPSSRPVRDLAAETRIPQPTVSKVLKQLARAGVVTSIRGPQGGYRLARPATEIGVDEIITALEGPIAVTECADERSGSSCAYERRCGVRANWQRINDAVHGALAGITLADMASESSPPLLRIARSSAEANTRAGLAGRSDHPAAPHPDPSPHPA